MRLDYISQAIDYIIDFIVAHIKLLVIIGIVTTLLIIALNFFNQFALVFVEVPERKSTTTIYATTTIDTIDLGDPGLKLLPRQAETIVAREGESVASQMPIHIPWYGYASVRIILYPDKNADKVAYVNTFNTACSTYASDSETLYSYNCNEPTTLSHIEAKDGARKVTPPFSFVGNRVQPYHGGVIGIMRSTAENANGAVAFVTNTGAVSSYNIPSDINRADIDSLNVFTNTFNTSDSRFGLITSSGVVYLGIPSSEQKSTATYTRFSPPKGYVKDEQQTICSFKTDDVYCYRGRYAIGDVYSSGKPIRETITKMSYTHPDATVNEIVNGPQGFIDAFGISSDGKIYGKYYKTVVSLTLDDELYKTEIIAQNVDSMATGDGLYYVQTDGLYKYNTATEQSSQVFYSKNIKTRAVYSNKDRTFVYGNVRDGGETIHAYSISDDNNTTPGRRLIDVLPTPSGKLPGVVSQTFYGNRLILTVIGSTFKDERGVTTLNERAFDKTRDEILSSLRTLGIDTNSLEITFKY